MADEKTNNVVELLFRVQGGGSLKGISGKGILNDISAILRAVEADSKSKLKITIDKEYLNQQVQSALRGVNVQGIGGSSVVTGVSDKKMSQASYLKTEAQIANSKRVTDAQIANANRSAAVRIKKEEEVYRKQKILADEAARKASIAQERDARSAQIAAERQRQSAVGAVAAVQNYKTSAQRYYDKYQGKINKNSDLLSAYNTFQNTKFDNVEDAKKQLADWKTACYNAGVETKGFGGTVKNLWNEFGKSLLTGVAVSATRRVVSEAVNVVKELDEAVVNLSMVTGYSRRQTQALLETYVDMGKRLGATTTEVANAANEWLRQGYSLQETDKLIETSVVLSKVGMLESAEATQYLTSALKGYKVEISDAMSIADKLTSVDMKAAVSTAGLAEAMSKTANSARLAGVDMNRLIGYIAAVGEVTQADMASVGTTFKTVFSRLSNIKLGKLEDENGEDITQSLNDAETVLARVGIQLRDTATSYRDMGDVFDEISEKWNKFNDVERNTIAMAFGGTRQKEQVLTLFENYGNAMEYAQTAANSSGTAMQKYDAYTSGLEKSLKSFQATWESVVNRLIDSDLLKGVVDLGTGVMNVVDGLAKAKVLLPTIIALVTSLKNVGEHMIENAGLCTLRKCA